MTIKLGIEFFVRGFAEKIIREREKVEYRVFGFLTKFLVNILFKKKM